MEQKSHSLPKKGPFWWAIICVDFQSKKPHKLYLKLRDIYNNIIVVELGHRIPEIYNVTTNNDSNDVLITAPLPNLWAIVQL